MYKIDSCRLIIPEKIIESYKVFNKKNIITNENEIDTLIDVSKKRMNLLKFKYKRFNFNVYIIENVFYLKNVDENINLSVLFSAKVAQNYFDGIKREDFLYLLKLLHQNEIVVFKSLDEDYLFKNIKIKDIDICNDFVSSQSTIKSALTFLDQQIEKKVLFINQKIGFGKTLNLKKDIDICNDFVSSQSTIKSALTFLDQQIEKKVLFINQKIGFGKTLNLKKDIDILQINRRANQSLKYPYLKLYNKTKELFFHDESYFIHEFFNDYAKFIADSLKLDFSDKQQNDEKRFRLQTFLKYDVKEMNRQILRLEFTIRDAKDFTKTDDLLSTFLNTFSDEDYTIFYFDKIFKKYFNIKAPKSNEDIENLAKNIYIPDELTDDKEVDEGSYFQYVLKLKNENKFFTLLLFHIYNNVAKISDYQIDIYNIFQITLKMIENNTERSRLKKKFSELINISMLMFLEQKNEALTFKDENEDV